MTAVVPNSPLTTTTETLHQTTDFVPPIDGIAKALESTAVLPVISGYYSTDA